MNKKIILTISFLGSVIALVALNSVNFNFCLKGDYDCITNWNTLEHTMYFFIPVFLFSLITYFTPERIFLSWWRFARLAIPVIFFITLIINLGFHHKPDAIWEDMFDAPAIILLYSIFVIGSSWQIWKGWKRNSSPRTDLGTKLKNK